MGRFAGGAIRRSDGDGRTCGHLDSAAYCGEMDVDVRELFEVALWVCIVSCFVWKNGVR